MEKTNYRHGDVLVIPAKIPDGATEVKKKGDDLILAEGEVTGHSHRFPAGAAKMLKWNDKTYLRVTKRAALSHEEHKALSLPEGDYEIKIQQDYEPSGWKRVVD